MQKNYPSEKETQNISICLCNWVEKLHCKKRLAVFPIPLGMSLTSNQTLPGREYVIKLFPARESLVSDIPAGDRKTANLFLQCIEHV
jgi:hypothetical protein